MRWISIDPAAKSGVAEWENDALVDSYIVKARGNKGSWYRGAQIYPSRLAAWESAYCGVECVVIERGYGSARRATHSLGAHLGWHERECAGRGLPAPIVLNVSEWRRVIREDCGVSWPTESNRCKALAVSLVREISGVDVSGDEADAVLLGRAAWRERLVAGATAGKGQT